MRKTKLNPLKNAKKSVLKTGKRRENIKKIVAPKSNKRKKSTSPKEKIDNALKNFESIKDIDPEFFQFLKKNDKELLEFNLLDSDIDESDTENVNKSVDNVGENSDDDADCDASEKFHKPNANLEVGSDESDFEDDTAIEDTDGKQKITLSLLRQWQTELEKSSVSLHVVRKVIEAFKSALANISGNSEEKHSVTAFKVVGNAAFNGIIQLCVLHLQPAIIRLLGLKHRNSAFTQVHKSKKWAQIRGCLRFYLTDLIRLIEQVSSVNILRVLLKHLHQMSSILGSFTALGKTILKRLIVLWATGEETVRVLAFLCILKITRNQQVTMLHHVLKAMYLSYVRNSKFVSPNTLPGINFMRRSLVEMFALDLNVSYQHVFLYIRQLAIHLRNAVILKKKDSFKAVYNWQFINSLRLFTDLLGATINKPQLQPLIYPLVTIAIGVIRLIPTAQYFPLRFHCIQALISLTKETQSYVPILPLIIEVLRSNTFNRKHTTVSMRPVQFTCILRLNKAQLAENGFRDEVIEQVCALTLEYLAHESSSLAFCDLVVPAVFALKAYLKDCRNANYTRKLKQLLDKIQDNARFIEQERAKINFSLQDQQAAQAWEAKVRTKCTPLDIYYSSWLKTHETKKRRQAAQTDSINDNYGLPQIKRVSKVNKNKNENGEVELFPSDSEDEMSALAVKDDDDEDEASPKKPKKGKLTKQKKKQKPDAVIEAEQMKDDVVDDEIDNEVDIVKDLDLNDW